MLFQQNMEDKVNRVNALIEEYLPKEEGFQKTIFEAMNYSIRVGGKRLRPILMEETYRMFGGDKKLIEPFMAAIEMIHTYSLVHDDLPAMDNDMYRRGQLTTHAKYGEDMAILAGDALLNYAYEVAARAFEIEPGNPNVYRAFRVLANKAGVYGMVGGQVVDVQSEKDLEHPISRDKLDFIYKLKTGALIEASLMIGAILAGATEEQVNQIEIIAQKVGLAFQIQDDILDVTSTFEELGKPIGSDEKNNKPTYVTFEGIDKANEDVRILSMEAIHMLEQFEGDSEYLKCLFEYMIDRRK